MKQMRVGIPQQITSQRKCARYTSLKEYSFLYLRKHVFATIKCTKKSAGELTAAESIKSDNLSAFLKLMILRKECKKQDENPDYEVKSDISREDAFKPCNYESLRANITLPNGSKVSTMSSLTGHIFETDHNVDPNWRHQHHIHPIDDEESQIDISAITAGNANEVKHRGIPYLELEQGGPKSEIHKDIRQILIEKHSYNFGDTD